MRAQTEDQTRSGNEVFDDYAAQIFRERGWQDADSSDLAYQQFLLLLEQAKEQ